MDGYSQWLDEGRLLQVDLFRSAGIIYVDGMEPVTVDKYCASIDLMPTIYNLLGVPYDSRLLMGRDILSTEPGLVIFNDLNWLTDYGRYVASTDSFTAHLPYSREEIPPDYVTSINDLVQNRFVYSQGILDRDYYRHLAEGPVSLPGSGRDGLR